MLPRRFALLIATFVVGVLLIVAGPAAAGRPSVACARHCGGESALLQGKGPAVPLPCIHDAGCGGGAALGFGAGAALAVLVGSAFSIGRAFTLWRRRLFTLRQPMSVLLTSGLFRPPRRLLDV